MKKYCILGIVFFSLMATTVYALGGNGRGNSMNQPTTYYQNCPYHIDGEECPYYHQTTNNQNYPYQTEDASCPNCTTNTNNNTYYYGTGGHHGRHHQYSNHH